MLFLFVVCRNGDPLAFSTCMGEREGLILGSGVSIASPSAPTTLSSERERCDA